jgi:hypothetical protein
MIYSLNAFSQSPIEKLSETILYNDSLFWTAYNTCDVESAEKFFTNDMEFYHDKGGITLGLNSFMDAFKKNLCAEDGKFRLRRDAIPNTLKVYPLQQADSIYGAILSGDHVFYVIEQGKDPRLDGQAKFTHLWLLQDGVWRMARILSYDHGPATYKPEKKN